MVNKVFKPFSMRRQIIMSGIGKKEVLWVSKEKDVKFVRLWFSDILGFLKSFAITVRELDGRWKRA
jgi:hypothetical protein